MLDYLRSFAYIEAIERTGSIRNAAKLHYITASALDRRLHELEQELGVQLFERHARGMRVTAAGDIFLHHMRAHRADSERMRMELDQLKGLRQGRIAVAASQAAASFLLPEAIRSFQADHPGVSFNVRVSTHAVLVDMLRRFEVDVALVYGRLASAEVHALLEIRQRLFVLMRAGHPLASRATLRLDECMSFQFALPGNSLALRALLDAELALQAHRPGVALESDSLELLRHYVRHNDALTFHVSAGICTGAREQDIVVRPLVGTACDAAPLCMLQLRGRALPHASAAFAESLGEMLAEAHDSESALNVHSS